MRSPASNRVFHGKNNLGNKLHDTPMTPVSGSSHPVYPHLLQSYSQAIREFFDFESFEPGTVNFINRTCRLP